jgi:hypothetical protein
MARVSKVARRPNFKIEVIKNFAQKKNYAIYKSLVMKN